MSLKMYEIGGCVRDQLLGLPSKDIDFAVEAPSYDAMKAELVAKGFEIFKEDEPYVTLRARFPRTEAYVAYKGQTCDFVLCRKDGYYSDGRRPDSVEPGTLLDDQTRRDFRMNAIAIDPKTGHFIDPFGGMKDIRNRLIACVGDPMDRFTEDALRALRALRFSITKSFSIENETALAINCRDIIARIADNEITKIERVQQEVYKMMRHDTVASIDLIKSFRPELLRAIFREPLWLAPTMKKA